MPWDDGLTGPARDIAGCDAERLRVTAGPGTGKTFAMMRRVARLLECGAAPERILVCTFTRTAASDLATELYGLGAIGCQRVRAGTLHSYCFSVLARSRVLQLTGRVPRPLLSFEEQEFLVCDLARAVGASRTDCKRTLKAFDAAWARLQTDEPGWCQDPRDASFRDALLAWLRFHQAMLVGELVPETLNYLRLNPLCPERTAFDHVVVDEYQDLNRADQELLNILALNGSLAVVGDEDQSIYGFRYAHPDGIRSFHECHVGTQDRTLDECRRCPTTVVALANRLIAASPDRTERTLVPRAGNPSGRVFVVQWRNMHEEAHGIAAFVHGAVSSGEYAAGRVLVLAPRREFGYAVRDSLNDLGTPAHSFYREQTLDAVEAKEAFTLLTLVADREDRVALRCWCGFGSPSLRAGEWQRLQAHCRQTGDSPWDALSRIASGEIAIAHTHGIADRFRLLATELARVGAAQEEDLIDRLFPPDAEWAVPIREMAQVTRGEDVPNGEDVLTAPVLRETLRAQITQPELPTDVDYVRVMSLQKSKGLTADLVVMQGSIQGLTPYLPVRTAPSETARLVEEGRRLFYVALTRTTDALLISFPYVIPADLAHRWRVPSYPSGPDHRKTLQSMFIAELRGSGFPGVLSGDDFLQQTGSTP